MENIESRVKKIIVTHLGTKESDVVDTANFVEDLGADSLDVVELIMTFEQEFDIQISDETATALRTVGDAITYIKSQKKA